MHIQHRITEGIERRIDCQCHLSLPYKFMTFNLMFVRAERTQKSSMNSWVPLRGLNSFHSE